MNIWKAELTTIIHALLGNPQSNAETACLAILAVLACFMVWIIVGKALHFPMPCPSRLMAVLAMTITLGLFVAILGNLYVAPAISNPMLSRCITAIIVLVVMMAAVVPFSSFLQKSRYPQTLAVFLLGPAAAVALILAGRAVFKATREGGKQVDKTRHRSRTVEKIME